MIKRSIRIIGYLLLFLGNIGLLWYFHNFLNLAVLVVMVFLPVVSILGTRFVADRLQAEWEGPYESMNKGEEFLMKLHLKNPTWLGVMHCKVRISVGNLYYQTGREHELSVPVRARKGQTVTYPITVQQCGRIEFRIRQIQLEDFLGIVAFRSPVADPYEVVVLPKQKAEIETSLDGYTLGMQEVEESSSRGSDFSEVQDVREYQPGDKLQNIHWKLSVKKDILMVKERVSMSSRQLFLLPELHDNEQGLMEEIFDCTYGILHLMLESQIPVTLVWWSTQSDELVLWKVEQEEQLQEGFRMIYYEKMYEDPTLGRDQMRILNGEEAQFLWVGDRASGIGEPLMEYGAWTGAYYGVQA